MSNHTEKDGHTPPAHLAVFLDALPHALKLEKLLKRNPIDAKTLGDLVAYLVAVERKSRQQSAADKKHAVNKKARAFVCQLWHSKRSLYKSNIQFSRYAAGLVLKKFALAVKPETISRDWVKGFGDSVSTKVRANAVAYVDGRYIKGRLKTTIVKV